MDWQTIETAPTDGAIIDLWVWGEGEGYRVPDAYWSRPGFEYGPKRTDGSPGWAAANMGYSGGDGYADSPEDGVKATHWMPLPAPPSK